MRATVAAGLALLVVTVGLAGCASESGAAPEPLSAREALESAEPTVRDWQDEAELLVLSGFEGGEDSPAMQRERTGDQRESFPLHADPLPGDGRAPQWVMVFIAGNETRSVRVSADEVAWMDEGAQPAGPGAQPVGNISIDSTDAVQRLLDDSEAADRIVAASDAAVFYTLGGTSEGPRWQVRASSHSQGAQETRFVDARTGEVANRTQAQTSPRTETFEGQLSAGQPNATHEVTVPEDGASLALELSWNGSDQARLSAHLTREGTSIGPPAASQHSAERFQARWDGLEEGNLTVDVGLDEPGEGEEVAYDLRAHAR
jgi:hypothetical protein